MGHSSHHSRRHSYEEYERRGHEHNRRNNDYHRHDEFRQEPRSPCYTSPIPPRSSLSCFMSPERHIVAKPKKEGNVLENMEASFTDGPLEMLKNCVHDGIKVMVWIRNHNGIRGICTGYVLAFDKFWNLLMQDVDEVYKKCRYPKTPFLQSVQEVGYLPEAKTLKKKKKKANVPPKEQGPKVQNVEMSESARQEAHERKKKRKEEEKRKLAEERAALCKRNVTKIFVRGDNVVLVRLLCP